jgi:predicted TIM-barrel fold metal-dependent hydrolase
VIFFGVLSRRRRPRFLDRRRNCRGAPRYSTSIFIYEQRGAEEIDHLEGTGVRRAVLLPAAGSNDRAMAVTAKYPDRFVRFTNADVRTAESAQLIRTGLNGGAIGIGELKYPVQVDGPEMRRVYDIAGELHVPVLIHFEEGGFNSGIGRLPDLLKNYPKTIFIGHAQSCGQTSARMWRTSPAIRRDG